MSDSRFTIDFGSMIRCKSLKNIHGLKGDRCVVESGHRAPKGMHFVLVMIGIAKEDEGADGNKLLNEMGWHHDSEKE